MSERLDNLEIYFVRHGQTEWNLEKKLQGSLNSPLTELGRNQAKQLSSTLKDEKFDGFYSSPLGRASTTAQIIKGDRDQGIFILNGIEEMHFGDVQGLAKSEFKEKYPVEYEQLWNSAHLYDPSAFHGETFPEMEKKSC